MHHLPLELQVTIASFMDARSLGRLALVCKSFASLVRREDIWQLVFLRHRHRFCLWHPALAHKHATLREFGFPCSPWHVRSASFTYTWRDHYRFCARLFLQLSQSMESFPVEHIGAVGGPCSSGPATARRPMDTDIPSPSPGLGLANPLAAPQIIRGGHLRPLLALYLGGEHSGKDRLFYTLRYGGQKMKDFICYLRKHGELLVVERCMHFHIVMSVWDFPPRSWLAEDHQRALTTDTVTSVPLPGGFHPTLNHSSIEEDAAQVLAQRSGGGAFAMLPPAPAPLEAGEPAGAAMMVVDAMDGADVQRCALYLHRLFENTRALRPTAPILVLAYQGGHGIAASRPRSTSAPDVTGPPSPAAPIPMNVDTQAMASTAASEEKTGKDVIDRLNQTGFPASAWSHFQPRGLPICPWVLYKKLGLHKSQRPALCIKVPSEGDYAVRFGCAWLYQTAARLTTAYRAAPLPIDACSQHREKSRLLNP